MTERSVRKELLRLNNNNELNSNEDKKELKKKLILNAALIEFSEKGYDKAVLDDIASKAGVAKGTLYLYYNDKKDIFSQTILFVVDNIISLIKKIADSNLPPIRKIESVIKDQVRYFLDNSHLFSIFQMAFHENLIMSNKKLFNSLIERKYSVIGLLRIIVNEAKKSGVVKASFPTDDIITVCDGIVTSLLKTVQAKDLEFDLNKKVFEENEDLEMKLDNSIKIIFEGILNVND